MQLADVGEFGLIDKIKSQLYTHSPFLIQSIGDDAAVFDWPEGAAGIITNDCLVENVHFDLSYTSFESLGWKSLAVNLSDVAAMAASPLYAVISLAVNEKWSVENVQEFYHGLANCSETYQCPVIGGDTATSKDASFISITVLGYGSKEKMTLRSGAQSGDLIFITGSLGKSRTGFEALSYQGSKEKYIASIQHFLKPMPHLKTMEVIRGSFEISSLIDISDGLSSDLLHICDQSQVGCKLEAEKLPIDNEVFQWCQDQSLDPIAFVLSSGEEYELLMTLPSSAKETFQNFCDEKNIKCSCIGEIISDSSIRTIQIKNLLYPLKPEGWKHF